MNQRLFRHILIAIIIIAFLSQGRPFTPVTAASAKNSLPPSRQLAQAAEWSPIIESFQCATANHWKLLGSAVLTGDGDTDPSCDGWLRLTDAIPVGQAGAAYYDKAIPSSDGFMATFQYATYGGTGADGFAFYLIDGATTTPTVGPSGGGFGYTGMTNGYVGIGFDELGNFSNGRGGPGGKQHSVVLRGSGNFTDGYNYLTGTQLTGLTPPHSITTGSREFAQWVRVFVIDNHVSVQMDFGAGWQDIITAYDLGAAPGQAELPETFKLGFSGGTGSLFNIHEVRNLTVSKVINTNPPTGERLRTLAERETYGPLIGFAYPSSWQGIADDDFKLTAAAEFNFLTPENALKMDAVQPSEGTFDYTEADEQEEFARNSNMKFHGHTLVWHNQVPSWVNSYTTRQGLLTVMNDHITNVMTHFKGKVYAWDVVNEAFNDDGTYRNQNSSRAANDGSIWYRVIGKDYIELAFEKAREIDPDARLIYNDYNLESNDAKFDAVYNMAKDFRDRGVPIDGIGFQMHLAGENTNSATAFTRETALAFAEKLNKLADLGLEVYITELDVRFNTSDGGLTPEQQQTQANIYRWVVQACQSTKWDAYACKGIQVWGIPDSQSWVPGTFPGEGNALLFDSSYNAKPAYYAVQNALQCFVDTSDVAYDEGNNTWSGPVDVWINGSTPTTGWTVTMDFAGSNNLADVANQGVYGTVTRNGQKIILKPSSPPDYPDDLSQFHVWGMNLHPVHLQFTVNGTYTPPDATCQYEYAVTLQARRTDGGEGIDLSWDVNGKGLPSDLQNEYSTYLEYYTNPLQAPYTVEIDDYSASSYTLTENVQKDQPYTVNLYHMLGNTVWVTDTVQVMAPEKLIYIPIVKR